jgi:MinD-like ATPase involved in chromosome partitioning or flagellar assembly
MVLVVEPDLGFADALSALLEGDRVVAARSMDEGVAIAEGGRLDLAILGPSFGTEAGVASAAALRGADPALLSVLVADVPSNGMLRMAIRAGLTDVIDAPVTPRKLSEVLGRTDAIDEARSVPVVFEAADVPRAPHPHVAANEPVGLPSTVPEPDAAAAGGGFDALAESVSHASSSDTSFEDAFAVAFGRQPAAAPRAPVAPETTFAQPPAETASGLSPVPEFAAPPPEKPMAPAPPPSEPDTLEVALPRDPEPIPASAAVESQPLAAAPVPEAEAAFAPPTLPPEEHRAAPSPPTMSPEEHFASLASVRQDPSAPEPERLGAAAPQPADPPPMPPGTPPMASQEPSMAPAAPEPAAAPPVPSLSGSPADLAGVGPAADNDPFTPPVVRRRPGGGRVITVMAGKGGSGKTITATNLAAALTERLGEDKVAIVDADLQFGDVALMMQIDPTRTIVEAASAIEDLTEHRLDGLLLRHDSGLRVLPAPLVPAGADKVNAKDVVRIVEMLRGMYQFVVVDTAPIFDDGLITLLEHSDDVLLVVDMDLPSVKNAKIALDTLRAIEFDLNRVQLVVNRANSKARLDLAELERALGKEISASIPSDRLVPQSVNEGVPAVAFSPRSRVAKAFHALAELFLPA